MEYTFTVANFELTPELAFKLGYAAAKYFGREVSCPKIIIGRDTRRSGQMLEAALASYRHYFYYAMDIQ